MIGVVSNFDVTSAWLSGIANRLPSITRNALNDTAFEVRKAEQTELRSAFNNPTPWVIKTIFVTKATNQRQAAAVGPTDYFERGGFSAGLTPWELVLSHNVYGGTRQHKAFEKRLHTAGILPRGWFAVPGIGARLNRYGNMSSGEIVQILTYVNAMSMYSGDNTSRRDRLTNRRSNLDRRGIQYFAITPSSRAARDLRPGIYKKQRNRIKPVLIFVRSVTYRNRVRWHEVGERVVHDKYTEFFDRSFNNELRRARR